MLPLRYKNLLRGTPLFATLSESHFERFVADLRVQAVPKGEYAVHRGDAAESLVILAEGLLQVLLVSEGGHEVGLDYVYPGEFFGEMSIIDGEPRSAWVVAAQDSAIVHLPRASAERLFYEHPEVTRLLLKRLCGMVRKTSSNLLMVGSQRAFPRVYHVLLSLCRDRDGRFLIESLPTQSSIAMMADVTRETVSRALAELSTQGVISKRGRELEVLDLQRLKALARG